MRIGLARNRVRPFTLRRSSAGEARHRQVEAAPEEMDRAALANKSRTKLCEYFVRLLQDAPETVRVFGIIRGVLMILFEGNRIWHFDRDRPDFHLDPKASEHSHHLSVKIG